MKRVLLILVSSVIAVSGLSMALAPTASAQGLDNFNARIALHVTSHFVPAKGGTLCDGGPLTQGPDDCSQYNTTHTTNNIPGPHVFVIAGQGGTPGFTGVSFGIDYNPAAIGGAGDYVLWTRCTDGLDFPNDGGNGEFPAEGGGVRVTWTTCQNSPSASGLYGVHAMVGAIYCYVYGAGSMQITPNNNVPVPELAFTDCGLNTVNVLSVVDPTLIPQLGGRIDFGPGSGYTPCGVVPTQETTWSRIKGQYEKSE